MLRERDRGGPRIPFTEEGLEYLLYVQDPSSNEHRDYVQFHTDFNFHVGKQLRLLRVNEPLFPVA